MSRKPIKSAAEPAGVDHRRPTLPPESARAAVKASMRAGFPAPAQLATQLGEAAIAEIEAELKAEADARAVAPVAPAPTNTQEP